MEIAIFSLSKSDFQDLISESVNACLRRHEGLQLLTKGGNISIASDNKEKEHDSSSKQTKGGDHE